MIKYQSPINHLLRLTRGFFRSSIIIGIFISVGCASIVSNSRYPVSLRSDPSGASVIIKNKRGDVVQRTTTPSSVVLKASDGYFSGARYSFEFSKDGYYPVNLHLTASLDNWYWGNLIFGGASLIGLVLLDPATGAMFSLEDTVYAVLPVVRSNKQSEHNVMKFAPSEFLQVTRHDYSGFAKHTHKGATAAVLSFDARGGLSFDEAALLTDRFSVELGRFDVYLLISQSKMKEVLELQEFTASCTIAECAVEAGQLLGVEYIIYGSVGRLGALYTINVYVASVEKGAVVAEATEDYQGQVEGLLTEGMPKAVQKILRSTNEKGVTR